MTNKLFILLTAFAGLMATTYLMVKTYTPEQLNWVIISLDNPPAPLPDPPIETAALPNPSDLALHMSPIQKD